MSILFDLHKKYGSVKVRDKYLYSWDYVKKIYPRYLDPIRNNKLTILEIGIAYGGALRAMRDYMPNSKLIGYDIKLDNVKMEDLARIELVVGSQSDAAKLEETAAKYGPFDVIIDDACHMYEAQLISLNTLWPHVKPGGFYFIEDVMSLRGKRGNASSKIFHHIKQEFLTEDKFAAKHHVGDMACISFHNTLICIEKKELS